MAQWKEQLKNIANTINDFIANDRFPEKIEPAILREAVRAYPMLGGKRLRPALVMWSCGLFGGKPESALPAGAADPTAAADTPMLPVEISRRNT